MAITDSNGNAKFIVPKAGTYHVNTTKTGYSPASGTITVTANGQTFNVTLTAIGGELTITIHVQNQAGSPVQGATVTVS